MAYKFYNFKEPEGLLYYVYKNQKLRRILNKLNVNDV